MADNRICCLYCNEALRLFHFALAKGKCKIVYGLEFGDNWDVPSFVTCTPLKSHLVFLNAKCN